MVPFGGAPLRRRSRRRSAVLTAATLSGLLFLLLFPALRAGGPGPHAAISSETVPWAGATPSGAPLADWATYHGGENRSGFAPTSGPTSSNAAWVSCPNDPNSGTALPIATGPVANATRVFVSNTLGTVFALDRTRNGTSVWNRSLGSPLTTPDLAGSLLLVGGANGYVTALNASTGAIVWATALPSAVRQSVSVDNATVFVALASGELVALRLATGSVAWSRPLGAPDAAGLALEGGVVYAADRNGSVEAFGENGTRLWSVSVGAGVVTAPSVSFGRVAVGDERANLSLLWASNGSLLWRVPVGTTTRGDAIESTPILAPGRVLVTTDLGATSALTLSNGSVEWRDTVSYLGWNLTAAPAATPGDLYLFNAYEQVEDLSITTGAARWVALVGPPQSSPALDRGFLFVGDQDGCVLAYGRQGGAVTFPVSGTVVDPSGAVQGGANVTVLGYATTTTGPNGSFTLYLPNGSYPVLAWRYGFLPGSANATVAGPVGNLTVVLAPLVTYPVSGLVRDTSSARPVADVPVELVYLYPRLGILFTDRAQSGSDGTFHLEAPNGTSTISLGGGAGFTSSTLSVNVQGGAVVGLLLEIHPVGLGLGTSLPVADYVALPLVALGGAAGWAGYWAARRRRVALGLPTAVLSPFARFVAMRALIIPGQLLVVLTILYVFGNFLLLLSRLPCPAWSPACISVAFGHGYGSFVANLFTGNWGNVTYGHLVLPAWQFLAWWFPDSLELAVAALLIAAILAYPIGLQAGWRRNSAFDLGARFGSLVGLLLPSFLVLLVVLGAVYVPYLQAFGDPPFGTLPTTNWLLDHGGYPAWIGLGGNTSPTGIPLLDGLVHRAWGFELIVLTKVLIQALAIALIYVAIFLRYARHAVAEVAGERHLVAARARGVDEHTILWSHAGRRVLPIYILVFGITLPVYVGTQCLVEALASDQGLGTLLLAQMTHVAATGFGFSGSSAALHPGNFYQVTIFLVVLIVLLGNLASDVLARYLDPRILSRGGP